LLLNEVEREHLFLLGLGRPPEVRYCKDQGVTPRLQHLIDALYSSPALILTSVANVAAWNRAAASVMYDFGILAPEQRNLLRIVFLDPRARAMQDNWQDVGRYLIGLFRANIARAGTAGDAAPLVEELRQASAEFREMWDDNDVCSFPGETLKHIRHPLLGLLAFEYSTFAIDGRVDLSMMIYHPATSADAQRITSLMQT
ncbi:MAG: transcriptional regulator, partial [Acetobacteraceae bacterium]|nr:transcriptional regulator [Acetobacteraceae bacterium]